MAQDFGINEGTRVYTGVKEWAEGQDSIELNEYPGYHIMFHVSAPDTLDIGSGYNPIEYFIPIKLKKEEVIKP